MVWTLEIGSPPVLALSCGGEVISVRGTEVCQPARRAAVTRADVRRCAEKLGDIPFALGACDMAVAPDLFISLRALNDLRREGTERLRAALVRRRSPPPQTQSPRAAAVVNGRTVAHVRIVCVGDLAQAADADVLVYKPAEVTSLAKNALNTPVYAALPVFASAKDLSWLDARLPLLRTYTGLYAENVWAVGFARAHGLRYIAGWQLNVTNAAAARVYADADYVISSPEAGAVAGAVPFAAGKIPLMTLLHCPHIDGGGSCQTCPDAHPPYRDDHGKTLEVHRRRVTRCQFELVDAVPVVQLQGRNGYFDFTYGTPDAAAPKNAFRNWSTT
jgi:hypothetical protein